MLSLIQKHKIDIFDIPISDICEEYTKYLDSMRSLNMEIASEYIAMAAELVLIKSRMLLPREEDQEDPRTQLVDALLEYRRAKQASLFLRERSEIFYDRFIKQPDELDLPYERAHDVALLAEAFRRMAERTAMRTIPQTELFDKIRTERWYTVEEKMVSVMRRLYRHSVVFESLFESASSKNELCAVFMALLELVRSGRVCVKRSYDGTILLTLKKDSRKSVSPAEEERQNIDTEKEEVTAYA